MIGVLTGLQLFGGLAMIIWVVSAYMPMFIEAAQTDRPDIILGNLGGLVIMGVVLGIFATGMLIFYIVHAAMNTSLSTPMKVLWIILFLFFGGVPEVVYFFMEIVPEHSLSAKLEQ